MSGEHGKLNLKLGFQPRFNTILWNGLTSAQKSQMYLTEHDTKGSQVHYPILPPYPKSYNPRSPARMPPKEYPNWFYHDREGKLVSVISHPLDQAKCGSCWAFSSSTMFTDTVRHMLMTIFKDDACFYSTLFNPIQSCTGEIGVEDVIQGVANVTAGGTQKCSRDKDCNEGICLPNHTCLDIRGVTVRDQISPYFTVGFAPKLKDSCSSKDPVEKCLIECSSLFYEWKRALSTSYIPTKTASELGIEDSCSGCEGNAIVMPLYLFVNQGVLLLSQFPIQEWGCIYGTNEMRKTFCTEEFLKSTPLRKIPPLIQADKYGHFVAEDVHSDHPPGINSMEEWMQAEILNNASITIGFLVYPAFFEFFEKNPKGIFTFKEFKKEIDKGEQSAAGGHAVDIIGWDEDQVDGELVQYWIIRNSWGQYWGDEGFFRFERGMDDKLRKNALASYLTHFEDEFGTLYYAPYPNRKLYTADHFTTIQVGNKRVEISKRLAMTVHVPPAKTCETVIETERRLRKQSKECLCEPGYIKNTSGVCVHDLKASAYGTSATWIEPSGARNNRWKYLILALVFLGTIFISWKIIRRQRIV